MIGNQLRTHLAQQSAQAALEIAGLGLQQCSAHKLTIGSDQRSLHFATASCAKSQHRTLMTTTIECKVNLLPSVAQCLSLSGALQ